MFTRGWIGVGRLGLRHQDNNSHKGWQLECQAYRAAQTERVPEDSYVW